MKYGLALALAIIIIYSLRGTIAFIGDLFKVVDKLEKKFTQY